MRAFLIFVLLMAYTVNPKVHHFESVLNVAASSHMIANRICDPKKQRDNAELSTPRVEFKTALDAYGPNAQAPHQWINQGDRTKWPDTRDGKLYATVVTRRGADGQDHEAIVGTVRSLLQSCSALSGHMEFHKVEKLFEGGSAPSFKGDEHHDVTVLSFDFRIRILFGVGLNEGQPNPNIFLTIES